MCSSAVEKAVRAMHGVTSCHVSLATNMATVVFSPIVIESQAIADEIEDIGYDVTDVVVIQQHQHQQQHQQQQHPSKPINATQRERVLVVELTVGGMTCSMCSSAVEKAVLSMGDGVVSCHVSLATNLARVVVRHDTDDNDHTDETRHHRVTPEMIREVIEDIGYDVTDLMVQQQQQQPPHRQLQQLHASNTNVNSRTRQQHHHASYDRDNLITGDCYRDSEGEGGQQAAAIEDDDRLGRILRQQDKQLSKRRREFFWSLVFVVPIMTITMVIPDLFPPSNCIRRLLEREIVVLGGRTVLVQAIVVWILTTPIQFVCGYSFYKTSYHGIMRGVLGMDVLVCVGTTSSYVYAFIAMTMNDQGYRFFETSAVLICFVLLGKWMNAMAVRRTSEALTQLMSLQPKTCIKVTPIVSTDKMKLSSPSYYHKHEWDLWNPTEDPYTEEVVPIQTIHPGDLVKILKGASIPADGVVLHGEMTVDQSMITGESIPVLKEPGDDVLGGTICSETGTAASTTKSGNSAGSASSTEGRTKRNPLAAATFVRVTGVGAESALSQIVQLVQEAQNRHVPIQTMADSIASVFVPVVVALSLLTFLAWYSCCRWGLVPQHWYGDESPATFSLLFGIAALVISCPCALGLATPTGTY
jgi:Cu+-exporting ATPase